MTNPLDDEEPIRSESDSPWDEPKLDPAHAALDLRPPPLARINRNWLIGIVSAIAVLTLGSVVFAMAHHNTLPRERDLKRKPFGNSTAPMPPAFSQLEMATTPAAKDDGKTFAAAANAMPGVHDDEMPPAFMDDNGAAAERARAGYEPMPRNYAADLHRAPTDVPDATKSAANTFDPEAQPDLPPMPKPKESEAKQEEFHAPSPAMMPTMPTIVAGGQDIGKLAAALQPEDDDQRKERFMQRDGIETLSADTEDLSECDMSAGTPAVGNMLVATNSDIPSGNTITFTVTKTVYCGADNEHVALPQGSKFTGEANPAANYGQERQQLCMKQLERPASLLHPNKDRKQLGCFVVADIQGAPGMPADVDNHWGQVIGGSLLSAILSLGTTSVAGDQTGFAPTLAQNAARNAGQNLNQAGNRIVQRELARKPTLTTEILEGVTVMFTKNLQLDPWKPRVKKGWKR